MSHNPYAPPQSFTPDEPKPSEIWQLCVSIAISPIGFGRDLANYIRGYQGLAERKIMCIFRLVHGGILLVPFAVGTGLCLLCSLWLGKWALHAAAATYRTDSISWEDLLIPASIVGLLLAIWFTYCFFVTVVQISIVNIGLLINLFRKRRL